MAVEESEAAAKGQLFAAPDVWLFQWAHNMLSVADTDSPPVPDVHNGRDLWATRQGSWTRPCGDAHVPDQTGHRVPFNAVRAIRSLRREREHQVQRLPGRDPTPDEHLVPMCRPWAVCPQT